MDVIQHKDLWDQWFSDQNDLGKRIEVSIKEMTKLANPKDPDKYAVALWSAILEQASEKIRYHLNLEKGK